MLIKLAVAGYRSIRNLVIPLERLTVITGANGAGKSSLYRSLRLLSEVANGRIVSSLAQEGGLASVMWAGPEKLAVDVKRGRYPVQGTVRRDPVSLRIGFSTEDYGYAIDLGLPIPQDYSLFNFDPQIKAESLWIGEFARATMKLRIVRGQRSLLRKPIKSQSLSRDHFRVPTAC